MSASSAVSPDGFTTVRGRERGYRPEQVDRALRDLTASRDQALDRAAALTARTEELAAEAARLREAVSRLAPQDYASLGPRAQEILGAAEAEAADLRDRAESAARDLGEKAEAAAAALREAAREHAGRVRGDDELHHPRVEPVEH
ncbi:cellulose-binding protein, partial [Streptomyces sp. NPDC048845]